MEKPTTHGRGLEEVSRYYLSGGTREEQGPSNRPRRVCGSGRIVRVCHPGSGLMQSCIVANLALELARNRSSVVVWDCPSPDGAGLESFMESLDLDQQEPASATVRLYGLPDIVIHRGNGADSDKLSDLVSEVSASKDDRCLLVNSHASLESFRTVDLSGEWILLARPDEKELLRCYAYIRVIHEQEPSCTISLVLDDVGQDQDISGMAERFTVFIEDRLRVSVRFLGALRHDGYLRRSIREKRPLVLWQGQSGTKDDLTSISAGFLGLGQGWPNRMDLHE